MNSDLCYKSIVLITGKKQGRYGTGFVIYKDESSTYLVTCKHVVDDVGGPEELKADNNPVTEITFDAAEHGFDLSVLRGEGMVERECLWPNIIFGEEGRSLYTVGYHSITNITLAQDLKVTLHKWINWRSDKFGDCAAWYLKIDDPEYNLEPGYSGAPVVDVRSGSVIGVISIRQGEKKGLAISIEALQKIWPTMPTDLFLLLTEPVMNLKNELDAFKKVVTGQDTQTRLILVNGEGGMGKSYLLSLYRQIVDLYRQGGHDHRFGHGNQQVSDRGMRNQSRLNKKIDDLQRQWELFSEKLSGLNEQWILETRFEEKLRLRKLIDDTTVQRDQVEEQLKDMESQLAKVGSDAKESAGRNDDQGRQGGYDHSSNHGKRIAPMLALDKSNIQKIVDLLTPLNFRLESQTNVESCIEQIVNSFGCEYFLFYDKFLSDHPSKPLPREEKIAWLSNLTRQFFIDLSKHTSAFRMAIFFDPYEKADPVFKHWLTEIFLPCISTDYHIIMVIAGREKVIPPPGVRGYRHFSLQGVTVDWYHHYVERCKAPIAPQLIDEFHKVLQGEPKRFVEYVIKKLEEGNA
jgi:hypothetical protein